MKPVRKESATVKTESRKMLICSTGNITRKDAEIFMEQSLLLANKSDGRWVIDIFYGFLCGQIFSLCLQ